MSRAIHTSHTHGHGMHENPCTPGPTFPPERHERARPRVAKQANFSGPHVEPPGGDRRVPQVAVRKVGVLQRIAAAVSDMAPRRLLLRAWQRRHLGSGWLARDDGHDVW